MNRAAVEKIADAILYEGYMLYPYRPSAIKNRQRWNFGILYPPSYEEVGRGTGSSRMRTECLLIPKGKAALHVRLRFLHLLTRQVTDGAGDPRLSVSGEGRAPESWDEGQPRTVELEIADLASLTERPLRRQFRYPENLRTAIRRDRQGQPSGAVTRSQCAVTGSISCSATSAGFGAVRLAVEVVNETVPGGDPADRNEALRRALLSAHSILHVEGGEFVSLLEPPKELQAAAKDCKNTGNFPVLLGDPGDRDRMLASPILLYDYPRIAPESAGDFFDGTEIDELLTLRVLTLTEAEKKEMSGGDDRVRALLQRTEQGAREQLRRTHGAIRGLRPLEENSRKERLPGGPWETERPEESVTVRGVPLHVGDRVRLRPGKTADIMDLALQGKVAVVEAIERDFEERVHLAVVLEDDPGRDLGLLRQPGHRFFFSVQEVEPLLLKKDEDEDEGDENNNPGKTVSGD